MNSRIRCRFICVQPISKPCCHPEGGSATEGSTLSAAGFFAPLRFAQNDSKRRNVVLRLLLVLLSALAATSVSRGQVVITEIMHSPGGADALWEWIEIVNGTGAPLDLDGWVFDDDDDPSITAANISSAGGTRNTIVPAGGAAVLYAGDELGFLPERFNAAWGGGITLIGIDGFTTLTGTDSIGLWSSHASYMADAIPMATSSPRRTFANTIAAIDYSTGFPVAGNGHSIAWNGSGNGTSGGNWAESQAGSGGAFASVQTTIDGAPINSTDDRGNPGIVPAGPASTGLLITEIMFAPSSPLATAGFAETDFEWIEVLNNTGAPINFATQPHVFDDDDGSKLSAANISSGALDVGESGILFNNATITTADMQAMWGAEANFIPVNSWPSLNNSGGDTIAIWPNYAAYNTEAVTGSGRTHDNASAAVTYNTLAGEGWPTINNQSSIWLNNLTGEANAGANWTRAGAAGDTLSQQAEPIFQTAIDHPGGDVGSPGYAPGVAATLPGDFNDDNVVDAADYVVWRKSSGPPADYQSWRINFGIIASGSGSAIDDRAVPEPVGIILMAIGLVALCVRRRRKVSGIGCRVSV